MAYCTNYELTLLSGTTLSITIQDAIIAQADREIDTLIGAAGLSPPASDDTLKAASLNLSKAGIITHNLMTQTQTKSVKVGDITIQDDPDKLIEALTAKAMASVSAYIAYKTTGSALPISVIAGRLGAGVEVDY